MIDEHSTVKLIDPESLVLKLPSPDLANQEKKPKETRCLAASEPGEAMSSAKQRARHSSIDCEALERSIIDKHHIRSCAPKTRKGSGGVRLDVISSGWAGPST